MSYVALPTIYNPSPSPFTLPPARRRPPSTTTTTFPLSRIAKRRDKLGDTVPPDP